MPRDTDHRAIEGHRHEIRPLTPDEERELVQRYNAMHEALAGSTSTWWSCTALGCPRGTSGG